MRAHFILWFSLLCNFDAIAEEKLSAYQLVYDEKEQGTDFYPVTYTITDNYIRVDDGNSESGFILFDIKAKEIYSVSHSDESILVIPSFSLSAAESAPQSVIHYELMAQAPKITGKQVYSYRVTADSASDAEACMDIKVAAGLLPEIAKKLKLYQSIIAGQQIKNIITTPEEYRTACYMIDQVYNQGLYYDKGLPVHEWHRNEKLRMLRDMGELEADAQIFKLPDGYRKFKVDEAFN